MATLSSVYPTLLDRAKMTDPDGKIAMIADIISEEHPILDDIPWIEGNSPTGHLITVRTGYAAPTRRLINSGVAPNKGTTGQIFEPCEMLEAQAHQDATLAELGGDVEGFRMTEDKAHISGLGNTLASDLFTADAQTTPEAFDGFQTRYFTLGSTYVTSSQVIEPSAGNHAAADLTSIWLVAWHPDKCFCIYPKGTKAGLQFKNLGLQNVLVDATNNLWMMAYVSWYQWLAGLCIKDYRSVVRICNLDVSQNLTAGDSTDNSDNITKLMSRSLDIVPKGASSNGSKLAFYMNRSILSMLRVKLEIKGNMALSVRDVVTQDGFGRKELTYYGIPCRLEEAITSTESAVLPSST